MYGGAGADKFELSQDVLIADAETVDSITLDGKAISGGVRWKGQESSQPQIASIPANDNYIYNYEEFVKVA